MPRCAEACVASKSGDDGASCARISATQTGRDEMVAVDRDAGAISELAFSATGLADFEQRCFSFLKPILGFDTACSVWSGHDGTVRHVTALEYDRARLLSDFPRYMSELLPRELFGFAAEQPVLDVNVIASQRRAR